MARILCSAIQFFKKDVHGTDPNCCECADFGPSIKIPADKYLTTLLDTYSFPVAILGNYLLTIVNIQSIYIYIYIKYIIGIEPCPKVLHFPQVAASVEVLHRLASALGFEQLQAYTDRGSSISKDLSISSS